MLEHAEDEMHELSHGRANEDFAALAVALQAFAEDFDDGVVLKGDQGGEVQGGVAAQSRVC